MMDLMGIPLKRCVLHLLVDCRRKVLGKGRCAKSLRSVPTIRFIRRTVAVQASAEQLQFRRTIDFCINFEVLQSIRKVVLSGSAPGSVASFNANNYMFGNNTFLAPRVHEAMRTIWAAAASNSTMYMCTVRGSQKKDGSMDYSKLLPAKKQTVALRFIGSSVAISGSIHRYDNGVTRIAHRCAVFMLEHQISKNERAGRCSTQQGRQEGWIGPYKHVGSDLTNTIK